MPTPKVWPAQFVEDGSSICLAQIYDDNDGSAAVQSDFSAITYKVYDINDPDVPVERATGTLTISSVIFNTMQTDSLWMEDSTGYNFKHRVPASAFPNAVKHRIEYRFVGNPSGEPYWLLFEGDAVDVYTS